METVIIRGGNPLSGTVTADGSKNAVLPLLFATLITEGVSVFHGVPDITDVRVTCSILRAFGVKIEAPSTDSLIVDTTNVHFEVPNESEVSSLRATTYLIGAMLARFGKAVLLPFGGCRFASRPIDLHLLAAASLGAEVSEGVITGKLHPGVVRFPTVSVGATVNALFMACATPGISFIKNPAKEPHVMTLVEYLEKAGAQITVLENAFLVRGAKLHGAEVYVIPDMIEAGTYLLSSLITGGKVTVKTDPSHLSSFLSTLFRMGANLKIEKDRVTAIGDKTLSFGSFITAPYPGFPTDLHPPTVPLFARHAGGKVYETVFPSRFGYLEDLEKFGILSTGTEPSFEIHPSKIHPATVRARDLRGGVSCVLSALAAEGKSRIENASLIARGYAHLTEKFKALGADITEE